MTTQSTGALDNRNLSEDDYVRRFNPKSVGYALSEAAHYMSREDEACTALDRKALTLLGLTTPALLLLMQYGSGFLSYPQSQTPLRVASAHLIGIIYAALGTALFLFLRVVRARTMQWPDGLSLADEHLLTKSPTLLKYKVLLRYVQAAPNNDVIAKDKARLYQYSLLCLTVAQVSLIFLGILVLFRK